MSHIITRVLSLYSNENKKNVDLSQFLKNDRLLNSSNPTIVIGVSAYGTDNCENSKMAFQKIRIDEGKIASMVKCEEFDEPYISSLCYEFQNDIKLCLVKYNYRDVFISLREDSKVTNIQMDDTTRQLFKNISFISPEFDKIEKFIE